jgi:hypothetical protein
MKMKFLQQTPCCRELELIFPICHGRILNAWIKKGIMIEIAHKTGDAELNHTKPSHVNCGA